VSRKGQSTLGRALCTFRTWGLQRFWCGLLSLRTQGLVHLRVLTTGQDTLGKGDQVDILGHSALRFTIKQIFGNEKYSRQAYLLDQWIGIPFREPDGGVKAGTLGTCSLILILPEGFPVNFLAFF
jgi:hypothetical protein